MKSPVYFASLRAESDEESTYHKIQQLFERAGFASAIKKNELCAIKVHFGERGNIAFIPPWHIRPIVDLILKLQGKPFITDANTLYRGSRKNAADHLIVALDHGFSYATIHAPIIIADGLTGRNEVEVPVHKKQIESAKIAGDIYYADSLIVVSHFKGHMMSGFGGAIKNLGMGCASPAGKRAQHNTRPTPNPDLCTGCGTCVEVCPSETIELVNGKSVIHAENCIGCGDCMRYCPEGAISLDWETEIPEFLERLGEYAWGVAHQKAEKLGFFNFLINIQPECDCNNFTERSIVPDIGILASKDPVALDHASFDLVNQQVGFMNSVLKSGHLKGDDKFRGVHENIESFYQLQYAASIGLGSMDYELIEVRIEKKKP